MTMKITKKRVKNNMIFLSEIVKGGLCIKTFRKSWKNICQILISEL